MQGHGDFPLFNFRPWTHHRSINVSLGKMPGILIKQLSNWQNSKTSHTNQWIYPGYFCYITISVSLHRLWPRTRSLRTSWSVISPPHVLLSVFLLEKNTVQLSRFPLTLFTVAQTPAPGSETTERLRRKLRGEDDAGLQQPTHRPGSTGPRRQAGECARCEQRRWGELMLPELHMFPVWQHFNAEANWSGKPGHASVTFPQINTVEMQSIISWRGYDSKHGSGSAPLWCKGVWCILRQPVVICFTLYRTNTETSHEWETSTFPPFGGRSSVTPALKETCRHHPRNITACVFCVTVTVNYYYRMSLEMCDYQHTQLCVG